MIFRELFPFEVTKFYLDNPTEYLGTKAATIPGAYYFGIIDECGKTIAATCYTILTSNLVSMKSTMVTTGNRGQGVGRFLNGQLEKHLKEKGFGKIVSHIYTQNLPSIILKLKLGYLIEGTLRDHDFTGQHEYVLGKTI